MAAADLVLGVNPLEHGRVLQHVWDDYKPYSAASNENVLQVTHSPILRKQHPVSPPISV